MLIAVMYPEGKMSQVSSRQLDTLIEDRRILGFKRSDGWTVIGEDPIRQRSGQRPYRGPERRRS